ncbi:MAG: hypothetical protein LBS09_03235 [Bacteroidales bacterium]|jgi:hypothetical protein|nr:hypothetical protein [Bacteroidales bacterium]
MQDPDNARSYRQIADTKPSLLLKGDALDCSTNGKSRRRSLAGRFPQGGKSRRSIATGFSHGLKPDGFIRVWL